MELRGLDELPVDVLSLICTIPKLRETSPESFHAFSAVNRKFHDVAVPLLYRHLIITTSSVEYLLQDLAELTTTRIGQTFLHHARILELRGHRLSKDPLRQDLERFEELQPDDIEPDENRKLIRAAAPSWSVDKSLNQNFYEVWHSDAKVDSRSELIDIWTPVALVLREFRRLSDLIFSRSDVFPPGLLDAMYEYHPSCRLHLHAFRFKSLRDEVTNPDEMALVVSPNLNSIGMISTWLDSNGNEDYNREALLETVSRAQNLKHVRVMGVRPAGTPRLAMAGRRPRQPWNGLVPPLELGKKASLLSLSFEVYESSLSSKKLDEWQRHANLSTLTKARFSVEDTLVLRALTVQYPLSAIKHLHIDLEHRVDNDVQASKDDAEAFFAGLPPLETLKLSGVLHVELLNKICQKHGRTLHELAVRPRRSRGFANDALWRLTGDDMRTICTTCPSLSKIDLTIKRSMSDRAETQCYESLATIPTLRTVKLTLDCTNAQRMTGPLPEWDETNRQLARTGMPDTYVGQFHQALVNSAVDETLARLIWHVLAANNAKLESLVIHPYGGAMFGNGSPGDLMTFVSNLSRSYRVTQRLVHDDTNGRSCDVVELYKDAREAQDQQQRRHERVMLEKWGKTGIGGVSQEVFDRLWPPKNEHDDWRDRWRSWPLQRSA